MNWVQENKFLTGFLAVMVIGVGVLGFKVLSAKGKLEEAETNYTAKATAYNRLRRLDPFPSRKNLDAFEAQKAEAAQAINAFQSELAKREFPVEPMTPEQFQDELKKAVTEVRAKAAASNVTLPKDKFYLGFDPYETAPPSREAAPLLGRQLKAIEWIVQQLIAARIVELKELKRTALPEEQGRAATPPAGRPQERPGRTGGDRPGDRTARGGKPDLVTTQSFDVVFIGKQHQFANVLNTIVSPKSPQFYIPRALRVANQTPQGPPRATDTAATPPPPVDPSAPPAPDAPAPLPAPAAPAVGDINYIVGEELIEVAMKLEIVDFSEVASK
jgi:hypothetical protein